MPVSEKARKEVERLLVIWDEARRVTMGVLGDGDGKDGGWLFGEFGIADIYFWPVLWVRFFLISFFPPLISSPAYSFYLLSIRFHVAREGGDS